MRAAHAGLLQVRALHRPAPPCPVLAPTPPPAPDGWSEGSSLPLVCRRDIIGILWPVRALLHIANIEYDYIEVRFTEWVGLDWSGTQVGDKLKKLFRNQHVPRYVDSEVDINQSLVM